MSKPYLILHKVRGEPAFDIAEKIQIGDEEGWIIPTSGHRAYPYWEEELDEIGGVVHDYGGWDKLSNNVPDMPPDWPDHYEAHASPKPSLLDSGRSLLEKIGLVAPREPVKRRI